MSDSTLAALSGLAMAAILLVFWGLTLSLASPVVREHCLDAEASLATRSVNVDSKWTAIVWPPLVLAPLDPPGRCVRNSPFTEVAIAIGLRDLGTPAEQVREHVFGQLAERSSGG